jgi:hypothetical protein
MNFLIQTIDGQIKHDFSFTLIQSIEYHKWFNPECEMDYVLSENKYLPDFIPIGSVEFVSNYLKEFYNFIPKPINIPSELMNKEWTGRKVFNGCENDIKGEKFVKSNEKIKSFTEICSEAPKGLYQISDVIEIQSEYRAFVYNKKLVGLKNYAGDFDVFPDVDKIKKMIDVYHSQPPAFTLDVAVTDKGEMVVIEVHDFFSCGLYGFAEHKILPFMFSRWFYHFLQQK